MILKICYQSYFHCIIKFLKDRIFEVFMYFDLSLKYMPQSILIIDESACTLNITKKLERGNH